MEIFFTSPGVLVEKFASQLDRVSGPLTTAIKMFSVLVHTIAKATIKGNSILS